MDRPVENFYNAFQQMDSEAMIASYHPDIRFEDPAFGELVGEEAKNMWRMLVDSQKGKDLQVELLSVQKDGEVVVAQWEARYTFGRTGRRVHNKIEGRFLLRDGLIVQHNDHFDLYRWSRQALGISGLLIGWTSFFRKKLQRQTRSLLEHYQSLRNA